MSRPQGTAKTGGRQKGARNKRTLDLSERLAKQGSDIDVVLAEAFRSKDAEWLKAVVSALPYFAPKLREQEVPTEPPAAATTTLAAALSPAALLSLAKSAQ